MSSLENQERNYQDRLRPFVAKQGLTPQEEGIRNSLQRKVKKLEARSTRRTRPSICWRASSAATPIPRRSRTR